MTATTMVGETVCIEYVKAGIRKEYVGRVDSIVDAKVGRDERITLFMGYGENGEDGPQYRSFLASRIVKITTPDQWSN